MVSKVEPATSAEARHAQSTGSMSTSTVSASSPKISMFGTKSGFVIPKNKLSGSLVPIFRGGKFDGGNSGKEEMTKQAQRKTKWGPDPMMDAAVKKGRALAYQTRLEQITQQLKLGAPEIKHNQSPLSIKQALDDDSASRQIDKESSKLQLLELERREVIGEILRLNPSYKPPPDYNPLLKEIDVPIPTNAHLGYNFIGLLLGPEGNTQKRLEEETGAKVQVYGIKNGTGEKLEITHSDKSEAKGGYEELYVNISADTYEKVDAAVALLELLFTPVSGSSAISSTSSTSLVAGNIDNTTINLKETPSSFMMASGANQGISQPMFATAPSSLQYQAFTSPWSTVAPPNVQSHPSSGFMPSLSNNSLRFPAPTIGPFGASPYGGQPPTPVPLGAQLPQAMQQHMNQAPQPTNNTGLQPPAYATVLSSMPSFATSLPTPSGTFPTSGYLLTMNPQPVPSAPDMSLPGRLLTTRPLPVNSGWSSVPQAVPLAQMLTFPPTSNIPMRSVPPVSPPATVSVSNVPSSIVGGPPSTLPSLLNMPTVEVNRPLATNFAPVAFPSLPGSTHFNPIVQTGPVSAPAMVPLSTGASLPHMPLSAPMPSPAHRPPASMLPGPLPPVPHPPPAFQTAALHSGRPQIPMPSQAPAHSPRPSQSGAIPGFSPGTQPPNTIMPPPLAAPKPPRSIVGDFTFRPLGSPSTPSRPNIHSLPFAAPQPPSFRPALQNSASSVNPKVFPGPLVLNQGNPSQPPMLPPPSPAAPLTVNPAMARPSPVVPPFSDTNSIRMMGGPSMPGPSVPFMPSSQNPLQPANRPQNPNIPIIQQLGVKPPSYTAGPNLSNAGGGQIYDPFSPTSVSSTIRKAEDNHTGVKKAETDSTEYDDLMASVGVK